jgi:hypothetical protein
MTMPTDYQTERVREKVDTVEAIEHALSKIEGDGREPDPWERAFLLQAVNWLFRGGYRLATVNAELAMTPQHERSRTTNIEPDPMLDLCDIATLRSAFREGTAEPVREFPAFGRIIRGS